MADTAPPSFWMQANALLRKNLTYQKRNVRTNIRLILVPFYLCILLVVIQFLFDTQVNNKPDHRCGCKCIDTNGDGTCKQVCGIKYSSRHQVLYCAIPSPPKWPPLLQIPEPEYSAVIANFISYIDLPDNSCRQTGSCPAIMLFTGNNRFLGGTLSRNMLSSSFTANSSDLLLSLTSDILGSASWTDYNNFLEEGIVSNFPLYSLQLQCAQNSTFSLSFKQASLEIQKDVRCLRGLYLWRNTSSEVNEEIFKGYRKGNPERKINEIAAAYDFLNTDVNNLNVRIWYNSTYKNESITTGIGVVRVPRLVNLLSNAYLQFLQGPGTKMLFEFVKEMPKPDTELRLDIASLIGPLFFTWVVLLLFPVILTSLVYEKQQRLRIMMKMHGLGDGPYWMISYAYFLTVSLIYVLCLVVFGSVIGLNFFRLNSYSIQFLFYFIYLNLQISLAFLASSMFSNVKTATVVAYILVYGTGLLGAFLFQFFIEDTSFPRGWIVVWELYPGFSLYRGLYEFSQYAFQGSYNGTGGMKWRDFNNSAMGEVFAIMIVEWFVVSTTALYINQISSSGKSPLFFLKYYFKKSLPLQIPSLQASRVFTESEKPDVIQESKKVEQMLHEPNMSHAIMCDNLKKEYPGRDGNPPTFAVRGLSLALPSGECFGMLGPNGAGKTSFINMMTGLAKPTSGTAFIHGFDIRGDMDKICTAMGVCPQHDLLWETLTGREHLLFYGRLKNLSGSALTLAVEESLRSVNLFHGGVADKRVGKYSGGMKRRLSVAISLIGKPKVVYLDEPSTGLDPASRSNLWNVVKRAKQNSAIILTTHSMEEAEALCDQVGIFVDGSLQCIGNPKELKSRFGGSYVLTMTSSAQHELEVEKMAKNLTANAKKIYHISGTQKFEIPKHEVRISEVFQAVEKAKSSFVVFAWGLADTTLEDVFVKVARSAKSFNVFS